MCSRCAARCSRFEIARLIASVLELPDAAAAARGTSSPTACVRETAGRWGGLRWNQRLGIAATLAANVAHGLGEGPVGAVVGAWPAVALVGSYELLMMIIRAAQLPGTGTALGRAA